MAVLVLFNKPYGVHSQFRKDNDQMMTLADYFSDKSLRAVGRLDKDSEGLLLLTDDGRLNHAIATPDATCAKKFPKTYLVQVENTPNAKQIAQLEQGVMLKDGKTLPACVQVLSDDELPVELWERAVPIRQRKNIPTAWLKMTIYEGKNRQVRRMVAHVGLPCLRLIRLSVGAWSLLDGQGGTQLGVGECVKLTLSGDDLLALGVFDRSDWSSRQTQTTNRKPNQKPNQNFAKRSHHKNQHATRQARKTRHGRA